jgi:hypothetical protein
MKVADILQKYAIHVCNVCMIQDVRNKNELFPKIFLRKYKVEFCWNALARDRSRLHAVTSHVMAIHEN